MNKLFLYTLLLLVFSACTTVRPGERGIRQANGRLRGKVQGPGPVGHWPIVSRVIRVPVRTTKLEVELPLPSKEGLTVDAEISILYRVKEDQIRQVLEEIGMDYESAVVLTTFRSAAANVASRHAAKDMHSGARPSIEREIRDRLREMLADRGFEVESVLLKSIRLPDSLSQAIQAKLAAEQAAQQMAFVLETERREAERLRIEAEGIRDAQRIVDQGLTPLLIQWKAIEAFRELAESPNSKIIFTDGKSPLLLPQSDD